MRRVIGSVALLAAFLLAGGDEASAQKKKPADPKPAPPAKDSGKLNAGEYVGTVKTTPGTDRSFVLTIETTKLVPTGGGKGGGGKGGGNNGLNQIIQGQAKLQQLQAQMATARTPQQAQNYARQMQQQQLRLQQSIAKLQQGGGKGGIPGYKTQVDKTDIEFQASDKVKVRTLVLPDSYDEKGNLKILTKQQKDELKGKDKNLVGYESSLENVQAGAIVSVTLAVAPKPLEGEDAGKADKDAPEEGMKEKRMQVKMIVIRQAAPENAGNAKGKGKKAK